MIGIPQEEAYSPANRGSTTLPHHPGDRTAETPKASETVQPLCQCILPALGDVSFEHFLPGRAAGVQARGFQEPSQAEPENQTQGHAPQTRACMRAALFKYSAICLFSQIR